MLFLLFGSFKSLKFSKELSKKLEAFSLKEMSILSKMLAPEVKVKVLNLLDLYNIINTLKIERGNDPKLNFQIFYFFLWYYLKL